MVGDKLTCDEPQHQEAERIHQEHGQSQFQLHRHLQWTRDVHRACPTHGCALAQLTSLENTKESFAIDDEDKQRNLDSTAPASVPLSVHPKIHARFTHSHTHNEQVVIAPYGIILGRDMMFGAKDIASIAVHWYGISTELVLTILQEFLKCVFRVNLFKPNHIIFNNNCSLAQHVKGDPFFRNIGLSVDVFHFKSKHKETHTFCQEHCNLAAFPELLGTDGKA